ncbi:adenosylmethionine decarboxylase [Pelagibacteraceae bacterium]|nr:adenosylmethionine decarboxylase [Pelagibacteraceae bacterium]
MKLLEKKKKITKDHFIVDHNQIYAGSHLIIDLWNTSFDNRINTLKKIIKKAILIANATMLHIHLHRFGKEEGISGVAILAESHISVHTWPERDYIAFDIFMCGDTNPKEAAQFLIDTLKPKKNKIISLRRGVISID